MEQALLTRPIIGLPEPAYYDAYIDEGDTVRAVGVMINAAGVFAAVAEPVTQLDVRNMLYALHVATRPGAGSALQKSLRNECRLQMVLPEQKNITKAKAVLRAVEHSTVLMHPLMRAAEHVHDVGDRAQTFVRRISGAADLKLLWGDEFRNGWVVPDKEERDGRRKRKRMPRYQGFMMVDEDSKDNQLAYTKETKELELTLSLSFFSSNLEFVDGAQIKPPAPRAMKRAKYDMVEQTWFDGAEAPAATLKRARDHFGQI